MSYVFEADDTTVWSPSLRIGTMFVAIADGLGGMVERPTGLTAMASDYIVIDPAEFGAFVRALIEDPAAQHPVFTQLTQGFLAISAVLLERASRPVASERLTELTASMAASMPA